MKLFMYLMSDVAQFSSLTSEKQHVWDWIEWVNCSPSIEVSRNTFINKNLCLCTFQIKILSAPRLSEWTQREKTQSKCSAHRAQTPAESHLKVDALSCSLFLFNFWLSHRYAVWSLQSDAKCLSPCLLRDPFLGKAIWWIFKALTNKNRLLGS